MALQTKPFDIAEHLNTAEEIRMFLQEVAADGDEADFIHALNTAARAMGMTEVAKKAGISRASLYKSLAENGNPKFSTISKVTKALGCKLAVVRQGT
uniref:addiction module antidote protein n=1 Tax=Candidatus Electronema sp. TaxID=2698783 RepID=UPI00405618FE